MYMKRPPCLNWLYGSGPYHVFFLLFKDPLKPQAPLSKYLINSG